MAAMVVMLYSCSKDSKASIDTEYPVIDISNANAFPVQCSRIEKGETFTFRAQLADNARLGSVSVDLHHNFDHHTHSTEVNACGMEAVKAPVKPFVFIQNYPLPQGLSQFEVSQEIKVPADIDPGDYHFMIRLTDEAGWQTMKGLSVKIF